MLFCNTISLRSNSSHGFPFRGWGENPPPNHQKSAHNLPPESIPSQVDSSTYQRFIPLPIHDSFHGNLIINPPKNYIFGCS